MKLNIDYAALQANGNEGAQRTALFNSLKAALLYAPIMLACMSPAEVAKASLNPMSRIAGVEDGKGLDDARVKAFLQSDRAAPVVGAKWATPGDNPVLQQVTSSVVQFFQDNVRDMDLGYQVLFDDVPGLLGSNQDHFELVNASMGFTWSQQKPGGIIKPRREITEAKVSVPYLSYVEGFSLLDEWLQFSKYYHVEEAVNEFVSTYYDQKASRHYGLITGQGAGINVAFATDAATTFNKAVAGILRKCQAKGYALGSNPQVDILVSPENVGYVLAFLDATRGSPMIAFGTQKQPIAFSVRNVIVTTKVPTNDANYYVVLPGRKNKRADWKPLTVESKREPAASAEDWYGKGQYNAIVGDADQIARVALA